MQRGDHLQTQCPVNVTVTGVPFECVADFNQLMPIGPETSGSS
jgi:hypothetical protein